MEPQNKYFKLLLIIAMCLFFGGLFVVIGTALVPFVFDVDASEISSIYNNPLEPGNTSILKFLQFFNSIGLFILPGLIFYLIFQRNQIKQTFRISISLPIFLLTILISLSSLPLIGYLGEWNASLELPSVFHEIELWMKTAEDKAAKLTEAFLQMESQEDLLINLILIAILPAIGEELIFRGILQKTINQGLNNKHWGVWISALLFSAIHLQFYGFFPRVLLGAVFGYLFLWSRNLWIPIFAHFLNNGIAVLISYRFGFNSMEKQLEESDTTQSLLLFLVSCLFFLAFILSFRKYALRERIV